MARYLASFVNGRRRQARMAIGALLTGTVLTLFAAPPALAVTAKPPTCTITSVTPTSVAGNLAGYSFTGVGSDPQGSSMTVEWSFGGGADARITTSYSASFVSSTGPIGFDINGSFNVMLAVTNAQGLRCQTTKTVTVAPVPSGTPPKVAEQPAPGTSAAGNQSYAVLPFNDLGMHCADIGSMPFSILPPFNTLNAQVVRKGTTGTGKPVVVDPSKIAMSLRYSAASSALDPVAPNSINSTSLNWPLGSSFSGDIDKAAVGKSDFWDFITDPVTGKPARMSAVLFRGLTPLPDEGLQTNMNADHGRRMPGFASPYRANDPQPFSTFDPSHGWFTAQGIPVAPIDDAGRLNSYPLMRVQAVNPGTGSTLATTDAVVPVSAEVDCRDCHSLGGSGADPKARTKGPQFVAAASNHRYDKEAAAKVNIVRLHDFEHQTKLEASKPLVCASCHRSNALAGVGGPAGDPKRDSMSRAIHDFHGKLITDKTGKLVRDARGEPVLSNNPASLGDQPLIPPTGPMEGNCFQCHPGKVTQCFRGVMRSAGVVCADCHGGMLAVGGEYKLSTGTSREPWANEPRCESCHQGGPTVGRVAFNPADPAATPIIPTNHVFGEQAGGLYRNSQGHGGVACEGCHGSPHAIWPVGNPNANDNVTAKQLQGHQGKITECTVCHKLGSFPNGTLGGPHGLHPINDANWVHAHGDLVQKSAKDQCASCHGANHLGTRLAKTAADRSFTLEGGKVVKIPAGTVVPCNLCHSLKESFPHP